MTSKLSCVLIFQEKYHKFCALRYKNILYNNLLLLLIIGLFNETGYAQKSQRNKLIVEVISYTKNAATNSGEEIIITNASVRLKLSDSSVLNGRYDTKLKRYVFNERKTLSDEFSVEVNHPDFECQTRVFKKNKIDAEKIKFALGSSGNIYLYQNGIRYPCEYHKDLIGVSFLQKNHDTIMELTNRLLVIEKESDSYMIIKTNKPDMLLARLKASKLILNAGLVSNVSDKSVTVISNTIMVASNDLNEAKVRSEIDSILPVKKTISKTNPQHYYISIENHVPLNELLNYAEKLMMSDIITSADIQINPVFRDLRENE